jgi:hypothetical protein
VKQVDKYDHTKDKNKKSDAEDFPKGRSKNRRARPGAKQLPFACTMVKQNKLVVAFVEFRNSFVPGTGRGGVLFFLGERERVA